MKPIYTFKYLDKVNWSCLSANPNAVHILEQNMDRVDWKNLSRNPNAVHILEQNMDKIDWSNLSRNTNAIHLLEQNLDKVDWIWLSNNPSAIHILEQNMDKVDQYKFQTMKEVAALDVRNVDLPSICSMCQFWEQNLDKVNWENLSMSEDAICFLEKHLDRVSWKWLSFNRKAIHILKKNLEKVDWNWLSRNYNVHMILSSLDYAAMTADRKEFAKELVEYVFNPTRLFRLSECYNMEFCDYVEILS